MARSKKSVSFDIYTLHGGRWEFHGRHDERGRDAAVQEAKELFAQGQNGGVKVIKETYDSEENQSVESTVFQNLKHKGRGEEGRGAGPSDSGSAAATGIQNPRPAVSKAGGSGGWNDRTSVDLSAGMSATAPDEPLPRKSEKKRQLAGGQAPLPPTGKGPRPSAARVRFGRVMMKVVSSVAAGFFSALILTIIINLMFFGVGAGAGTATTFFLFAVLFVILTFGYVYLLISADEMDQMLEEQYEGLRSIFQLLFGKSTANKSKTETETKNPDQETAWDKRVRELLAEDSELEKAAQETKTAAEKPEVADKTAKTDATGTKTVSATGRERISATGTQHKEGAGEGPASGLVAANANPAETEAVGSGEGTPEGDDVADGPVPLSVEAEPVAKMVGQLNPIETTRLNELCKDVMQFFQPSVDFALENSPHAEEGKFNNFNNFGCHLYLAGACEAYARSKAIPGDLWYAAIQMASQSFSGSETQAALFARRYEEYLLDEKNQEILKFGRDAMVRWLDGDREEIGRSLVWALESWNQKRDHIKKPVAVLFTDIAGSTEYTQRFGDEASHRMLTLHNAIVRESLRFHNGREVKHTGDGIMASFDNPLMSARAAIAIQRGIAAFNASQPSQAIQLKIGINAGRPIEEDGDFFGSTVQLAARITDSAEPGTILVSDYFAKLISDKGIGLTEQGPKNMKGFPEPITVYEVSVPQVPQMETDEAA